MPLIGGGGSFIAGGGPIGSGAPPTPAATPTFSPAAGTYSSAQSVTPSSSTGGASIYYTTDGSTPTYPITGTTQLFTTAINVSASETIQAIAVASGFSNSAVGSAAYVITSGATQVFNYANFSGSLSALTLGNASASGSQLQLCNVAQPSHTGGSTWYSTKQPTGPFTTTFQIQAQNLTSGTVVACGMSFQIQNVVSPPGQTGHAGTLYGGDANMCGYSAAGLSFDQYPAIDSLAIKFDCDSQGGYPSGGNPSTTGMYLNGGPIVAPNGNLGLVPEFDLNPYGLNLYSNHTYNVVIVYDGSLLVMTMQDTTSGNQARFQWPLNLANSTNATGCYVGFCVGRATYGTFNLNNWAYYTGYNTRLATPTFSVTPGNYTSSQTVTISGPVGSSIYYTTNGLLPTSSSTLYTSAVTVSANTVLQAVAIESGFTDSLVATGNYVIGTSSNTINFPTGFSTGALVAVGFAAQSGTAYNILNAPGSFNAAGAVWFPAPVPISTFSTTFTANFGSGMVFVIQNSQPAYTGLTGVQITNNSGGISFNATTVAVGDYVTIGGTFGGTGSIPSYSDPTTYSVIATNGTTTATLGTAISWDSTSNPGSQTGGAAIVTTAGTPTGLTWSHNTNSFSGGVGVLGGAAGLYLSGTANVLGYGGFNAINGTAGAAPGILNSVGIAFDSSGGVGVYTNGASPFGSQVSSGLSFSGTYNVTVSYSGGTSLTLSVQSTGGGTTFNHTYTLPAAITSIVSGSTAITGFTAGAYENGQNTQLTAWTM